jgi:hypothetical protein
VVATTQYLVARFLLFVVHIVIVQSTDSLLDHLPGHLHWNNIDQDGDHQTHEELVKLAATLA